MSGDTRGLWSHRAVILGAVEAVVLAIWLIPASIHIVSWPASGPVRLALLAPAWQLAAGIAAGAVVAGLLQLVAEARRASFVLGPLMTLWLLAIPYLPWLPDRVPLLLVLAGPLRWLVAAVAVVAVVWRAQPFRPTFELTPDARRAVFAISLLLYILLGVRAVRSIGLGGDEPHYLIITESILKDGDLKIENNHQRGDYRSFIGGELRPDYMQRGKNGEIYSIHAPGLALLVLPAYVLGGYLGVVAFIALLGALTALAVFDLAERVAGKYAALVTWAGVCLSVPFVPYSWMIFPEMPGALIVAWSALWLSDRNEKDVSRWFWRGAVLASLPWLHTKFVVFLAIVALALAWRTRRRIAALAAFAVPIGISGLGWLYSFNAIYGKFDPEAPYGVYSAVNVINRNIPHGLLGIFLDPKFGLLFYSPLYLLAIPGLWMLWRRTETRFLAGVLFVITAAFVGSTARLYMFWGGNSAPARFLVPILPCLAPMVAVALVEAKSVLARAVVGTWLVVGAGFAAWGTLWPARQVLFSDAHNGGPRVLEGIQGASPLGLVVPTFTNPDWAAHIPELGLWGIAMLAALGAAWVAAQRFRATAWQVSGAGLLTLLLVGGMLKATPEASVREATALRGDTDVLWSYDGTRVRTLDYSTLSRVSPERLSELETMTVGGEGPRETGFTSQIFMLPPGAFDAVVWFTGNQARNGEVVVEAPPRATFARVTGALSNPTTVPFEIPVGLRRLRLRVGDAGVGGAVADVRIVPRAVQPPSERTDVPTRVIESIPGRERGYLIYTDQSAYPEGGVFWTRGTEESEVVVATGGAERLMLTLSLGPMSGDVRITVDGQEQRVAVPAGELREVSVPLGSALRLVPVRIQAPTMFRPAEVDTASTDMRRLGCQVRVTLE